LDGSPPAASAHPRPAVFLNGARPLRGRPAPWGISYQSRYPVLLDQPPATASETRLAIPD